ncbi:malate:quinone oxidoreductase [Escherichia coli]
MTTGGAPGGCRAGSSNGWMNAGTAHSAPMEPNDTPQNADYSISIEKAVAINEAFQISRQFWAHQVECARRDSAFIYQYRSAYELCLGRG